MDFRFAGVRSPAFHFSTAFLVTSSSSAIAANVHPFIRRFARDDCTLFIPGHYHTLYIAVNSSDVFDRNVRCMVLLIRNMTI